MGLSSDAAGPADGWSPSRPRPPKFTETKTIQNGGQGSKEKLASSANGGQGDELNATASTSNGDSVPRPLSPSPAATFDDLSDLNPFKLPSPTPPQRSASPRRPFPSSDFQARDPLQSSPPLSEAVPTPTEPPKPASPSPVLPPDSPAPVLETQSPLRYPPLRSPSPTLLQPAESRPPVEHVETASASPPPSAYDEPQLNTPALANPAQQVEADSQPIELYGERVVDAKPAVEDDEEVSAKPENGNKPNSIDVFSESQSAPIKQDTLIEESIKSADRSVKEVRTEEQTLIEIEEEEESKEPEVSFSPSPEPEDYVVEIIVEVLSSDSEAEEDAEPEVIGESEGGNKIDETREDDRSARSVDNDGEETQISSKAKVAAVNVDEGGAGELESGEQLETGEEPSTEEEDDAEEEERIAKVASRDIEGEEKVGEVKDFYDTREIMVGRKRSASLESLPVEVRPSFFSQFYCELN